jgi:hypothetical protein
LSVKTPAVTTACGNGALSIYVQRHDRMNFPRCRSLLVRSAVGMICGRVINIEKRVADNEGRF